MQEQPPPPQVHVNEDDVDEDFLVSQYGTENRERKYLEDACAELHRRGITVGKAEILCDRLVISCPNTTVIPTRRDFKWLKSVVVERGVLTLTLRPWHRPYWYTALNIILYVLVRVLSIAAFVLLSLYVRYSQSEDAQFDVQEAGIVGGVLTCVSLIVHCFLS